MSLPVDSKKFYSIPKIFESKFKERLLPIPNDLRRSDLLPAAENVYIIKCDGSDQNVLKTFLRDVILPDVSFRHENLLEIKYICSEPFNFIIMERASESLSDFLKREKKSEMDIKRLEIAVDCVTGLDFLHTECKRLHGDLHLDHVLIMPNGKTKLYKMIASDENPNPYVCYGGPEFADGEIYTFASEVWAMGWILYNIFTGKEPFNINSKNNSMENRRFFKKSAPSTPLTFPETMDVALSSLLADCLAWNPDHRPSISCVRKRLIEFMSKYKKK